MATRSSENNVHKCVGKVGSAAASPRGSASLRMKCIEFKLLLYIYRHIYFFLFSGNVKYPPPWLIHLSRNWSAIAPVSIVKLKSLLFFPFLEITSHFFLLLTQTLLALWFNLAEKKETGWRWERGCRWQAADGDTDDPQLRLQVAGGPDAAGVVAVRYRDAYKGYFQHNSLSHFAPRRFASALLITVTPFCFSRWQMNQSTGANAWPDSWSLNIFWMGSTFACCVL